MKILISPLNWGLGHAVRIIPIIKELKNQGFEVIIGATGNSYLFLKKEFPNLKILKMPNFTIRYSKKFFYLNLFFQIPKIFLLMIKNKVWTKKVIKKYDIKAIISDNNYGVRNQKIYSIFMTHQITIKMPEKLKYLEKAFAKMHFLFYKKYNEIWIPDNKNEINLSGDLSHKNLLHPNSHYIGILDSIPKKDSVCKEKYTIVGIISGPEPFRSEFEQFLINHLININTKTAIIGGRFNGFKFQKKNITFYPNLTRAYVYCFLKNAKIILSRSGYTTIMDLVSMKKTAILFPTPYQTEQIYLAEYLHKKGLFVNYEYFQNFKNALEFFLHNYKKLSDNLNKYSEKLINSKLQQIIYSLKKRLNG